MTDSEKYLQEQAEKLSIVTTHPKFLDMIKGLSALEGEARQQRADEIASKDWLSDAGIPLPDDFRISTRVFEPRGETTLAKHFDDTPFQPENAQVTGTNVCVSAGIGVCVSVGKEY